MIKMTSTEAKIKVLHYFRFNRKYMFCATEVKPYRADVLVSNEKEILEIEIKASNADLKRELLKKKHKIYSNKKSQYIPNKYFIAVPKNLVDTALDLTKGMGYGIIKIKSFNITTNKTIKGRKIVYCKIVKQAKLLNKKFSKKLFKRIQLRMGSELIREKLNSYIKRENDEN